MWQGECLFSQSCAIDASFQFPSFDGFVTEWVIRVRRIWQHNLESAGTTEDSLLRLNEEEEMLDFNVIKVPVASDWERERGASSAVLSEKPLLCVSGRRLAPLQSDLTECDKPMNNRCRQEEFGHSVPVLSCCTHRYHRSQTNSSGESGRRRMPHRRCGVCDGRYHPRIYRDCTSIIGRQIDASQSLFHRQYHCVSV